MSSPLPSPRRAAASRSGAARPSRRGALAAGAAALFAALLAAACGGDEGPRGVLLVSIDSLRADHVGAYGYASATRPDAATTPAIDRLVAAEGALFEHAVSTTSWTLPAHMALLTGLPNEVHGVRDLPDRLPADRRLLAEAFRAAGWRTLGLWSGPNLHPWFGFDRGFDRYVDCSTAAVAEPDALFSLEAEGEWDAVRNVHESSHRGVTGPAVLAAFESFAEGLGDERFFAFVHLWDVHYDYNAPPEYDVFFPGYDGPIDGQDFKGLAAERAPIAQRDLQRLVSLYDAEIRYADHQVERMLALLDARGRLDDTLVVVTADHGEEFLEHGALGHKATLYEEVLRVPLLVRFPGRVPAGSRHAGLVSLLDVAPTLADWCDLAFPARFGRSLRPLLEDGVRPDARGVPLELTIRPVGIEFRGVHAGDHKVVRYAPHKGPVLYDLAADPAETRFTPARELGDGDARVAAARRLWDELDVAAAGLAPTGEQALPAALAGELEKAGYLGGAADGADAFDAADGPPPASGGGSR